MFLKISQKIRENSCAGVGFLILRLLEACNFIKKRLRYCFGFFCFFVNSRKFLKILILETSVNGCFWRVKYLRVFFVKFQVFTMKATILHIFLWKFLNVYPIIFENSSNWLFPKLSQQTKTLKHVRSWLQKMYQNCVGECYSDVFIIGLVHIFEACF